MVRDADSDSGNCREDCCVQGEAAASQSFSTLGFIGSFETELLVSVPVICAVSQPVGGLRKKNSTLHCFSSYYSIYLHVFAVFQFYLCGLCL